MRKYHMWRANTNNLFLNSKNREEYSAQSFRSTFSKNWAEDVTKVLSYLSTSEPHIIKARLSDIIGKCLDLDERFSKQAANLTWTSFNPNHPAAAFNPQIVELERGQSWSNPGCNSFLHRAWPNGTSLPARTLICEPRC